MLCYVCPPVRKIIHSLKLVDYLHVQPDKPWYNYYIAKQIKWLEVADKTQGDVNTFFLMSVHATIVCCCYRCSKTCTCDVQEEMSFEESQDGRHDLVYRKGRILANMNLML